MDFPQKNKSTIPFSSSLMAIVICLFFYNESIFSQSWKFIVYGDTRTDDVAHRYVLESIMKNSPDYKFIINVGDVVETGSLRSDWQIWQAACDEILGGTGQDYEPPLYMACPGNHDGTNKLAGYQTG